VDPGDSRGEQIDPGDNKNFTIYIHVGQECEETTDYNFTVTAIFQQWNEYTGP